VLTGIGAGFSGSFLFANKDAVAARLSALLLPSLRSSTQADATLAAARQLLEEVSALSGRVRTPAGGVSAVILLGALSCGAVVLFHCGVDEILPVSRAKFGRGLRTITGAISAVSASVARARAHLSERIDCVADKVDHVEVASGRLEATLAGARDELCSIANQVAHCEAVLADVSAKQEAGNRGIFALCTIVNTGGVDAQTARTLEEVQRLATAALTRGSTACGLSTSPVKRRTGKSAVDEQLAALQQLSSNYS